MKRWRVTGIFIVVVMAGACLGAEKKAKEVPPDLVRKNCYSLLHNLLSDEKDVSKLRFIKREPDDLKALIKRISTLAGNGAKMLEGFSKNDPSLQLEALQLPPGEAATREAIASTKKKELLGEKGSEFELTLLLSQAEALNYGAHLAKVAGSNEPDANRAQAVLDLGEQLRKLHGEVVGRIGGRGK